MTSIARRVRLHPIKLSLLVAGAPLLLAVVYVTSIPLLIVFKEAHSAWSSPETEDGVARLRVGEGALRVPRSDEAGVREDDASLADFDGDGVADRLFRTYYHQEEPFASRSTSGMVLVRSGATDEILLGYAVPTPLSAASWCGDVDGNGTEDVYAGDVEPIVFGYVGR